MYLPLPLFLSISSTVPVTFEVVLADVVVFDRSNTLNTFLLDVVAYSSSSKQPCPDCVVIS